VFSLDKSTACQKEARKSDSCSKKQEKVSPAQRKHDKMVNLFDRLPMDVIKYEIIPYIANDYFARMGINFLLPPVDRQRAPLRQSASLELGMSLCVVKLNRLVANATNAADPLSKAEYIAETFSYLLKNPLILQHNMTFRNTAIAKAVTFADPDCNQLEVLPEANKANLVDKSCQLLTFAASTPYLYHCTSALSKDSKWSPIEGAGRHVVVDNERALIAAAKEERAKFRAAEKERRSKPHWRFFTVSRGRYRDDDYDGDWVFGYFDAEERWVYLEDPQEQEQEQEQPVVSRRGTVMDSDGWEWVVSKRRR
jgi:hypothetical protein